MCIISAGKGGNSHLAQIIVEIHICSTQVPAQQGGVCRKDGCHGDLPRTAQYEPWSRLPLVEMADDMGLVLELVCQLFTVHSQKQPTLPCE